MNPVTSEPPPAAAPPGWRAYFLEPLARVDAESRAYLASEVSRRADRKTVLVLVTAALCLTAQRYLAMSDKLGPLADALDRLGLPSAARWLTRTMWEEPDAQLHRLAWWAAVSLLTYVAVPGLVIRLVLGERLSDYGVKLRGAFADGWVYLVLFAVESPLIVVFSAEASFQETYPFYHLREGERPWPRLWLWEAMYFAQFFGVEFFFRGFLPHGTKHRFGAYSIFVMMVPYCMLHFFKPLPECLASVLGAVVLGFLSLRTRSIGMGTALHIGVAASMDLASLWRQGLIP